MSAPSFTPVPHRPAAINAAELARSFESVERVMREFAAVAAKQQAAITRAISVATSAKSRVRFAPNVDRGVAFLDERLGRDMWLDRIDPETLDVSLVYSCVVCQVTGLNFSNGLRALRGSHDTDWSVQCGFMTRSCGIDGYHALTIAWLAKVQELRAERDATRVQVDLDESVRITM